MHTDCMYTYICIYIVYAYMSRQKIYTHTHTPLLCTECRIHSGLQNGPGEIRFVGAALGSGRWLRVSGHWFLVRDLGFSRCFRLWSAIWHREMLFFFVFFWGRSLEQLNALCRYRGSLCLQSRSTVDQNRHARFAWCSTVLPS